MSYRQGVKHVFRYLKYTLHYGNMLSKLRDLELMAYKDANWASCPNGKKSISGYCVFYGGNLVP